MARQNLEMPMILKYWEQEGGTLLTEFRMVNKTTRSEVRRADAVIVKRRPTTPPRPGRTSQAGNQGSRHHRRSGQSTAAGDVLLGQALFSAALMKRLQPRSIRSVALCTRGDDTLEELLAAFPHLDVVVMEEFRVSTRGHTPGLRPPRARPTGTI